MAPKPSDWIIWQRLVPHVNRCPHLLLLWNSEHKASDRIGISAIHDYAQVGILHSELGNLEETKSIVQRALASYDTILGQDRPSSVLAINNKADVYSEQGRLDEAESIYQRALAGWEFTLGRDHPSTLSTFNNLATLYGEQGRQDNAESTYQRALASREPTLRHDHPDRSQTLLGLA